MNKKSAHMIEYCVLIALVALGIILMRNYVYRSVFAHLKMWEDGVRDSFQRPAPPPTLYLVNVTFRRQIGIINTNPNAGPCECASEHHSSGGWSGRLPDEGYCFFSLIMADPWHLDVECWRNPRSYNQELLQRVWGINLAANENEPCPYAAEWSVIETGEQGCWGMWVGGGGSEPCFLAGTLITLADGSVKKIEDIKKGEKILSFDEKANKKVASVVTKTFKHKADDYLLVNAKVKATTNHLFYSEGRWQEIGKLKVGSQLLTANLGKIKIKELKKIKAKNIDVYNLEIDIYQNYFADGYLVHNKPPNPR